MSFYFVTGTTPTERNEVLRAVDFYATMPPQSATPPYEVVVQDIGCNDVTLPTNRSAENPMKIRFGSVEQIVNFFWFLNKHKGAIWGASAPLAVRMYVKIDESCYFPVSR